MQMFFSDLDDARQSVPSITFSSADNMIAGGLSTIEDLFSNAAANESRDIFARKERVRAKKAGQWIRSERMVPNLVQVIVGTEPTESHLHLLLKDHAEESWTGAFGLHRLPIVELVQPGKSSAVKILDRYHQFQTSPVDVVLEVLLGYPGVDLGEEQTLLFQFLMDMASASWRKLVLKYADYPWRLAIVLDPAYPVDLQKAELEMFFQMKDCCLEDGAAIGLRNEFADEDPSDCLQCGSRFIQALVMCFTSKVTNVEIENNFARASSSRQYLRGKRHSSGTMVSKHILQELKQQHLKSLNMDARAKQRKRKHADQTSGLSLPCLSEVGSAFQIAEAVGVTGAARVGVMSQVHGNTQRGRRCSLDQHGNQKRSRVNGWNVCLRQAFQEPAFPGESKKARFHRIMAETKERFQDPAARKRWNQTARLENEQARHAERMQQNAAARGATLLDMVESQDSASVGLWGSADMDFPLSKELIEKKMNMQKAFVKSNHLEFCESWSH